MSALDDLITGALQGKVVVGTIEKAAAELAQLKGGRSIYEAKRLVKG